MYIIMHREIYAFIRKLYASGVVLRAETHLGTAMDPIFLKFRNLYLQLEPHTLYHDLKDFLKNKKSPSLRRSILDAFFEENEGNKLRDTRNLQESTSKYARTDRRLKEINIEDTLRDEFLLLKIENTLDITQLPTIQWTAEDTIQSVWETMEHLVDTIIIL